MDRREYIQAQKAKVKGLDRVLELSSKRLPSGHYMKDESSYLEFNGVDRDRDIQEGMLQPGDMQWSISEFMKNMDKQVALQGERFAERVEKDGAALQQELDKFDKIQSTMT